MGSRSGPVRAIFPLSSTMSRSAVFFPTPGARASAAASPDAIAAASAGGLDTDSSESAAFGPTPGTRDDKLEQDELFPRFEAEELLRVLAHDVMRVERDRVTARMPRNEHLVADAAHIDDDVIGAARDQPRR